MLPLLFQMEPLALASFLVQASMDFMSLLDPFFYL
jgi:hypothetical protein